MVTNKNYLFLFSDSCQSNAFHDFLLMRIKGIKVIGQMLYGMVHTIVTVQYVMNISSHFGRQLSLSPNLEYSNQASTLAYSVITALRSPIFCQ